MKSTHNDIYLVLYNLRSVHNVGSIFRTADGAGVSKLYLVGTTPTPVDRFGRKRNDMSKVSLGAEETVPYEYRDTIEELFSEFRQKGIQTVALEQDERAVTYSDFTPDKSVACIVGEETEGIPPFVIEQCDAVVDIPMRGQKESLNVSVSIAVVAYSFLVA